jgi:hypothetical protein
MRGFCDIAQIQVWAAASARLQVNASTDQDKRSRSVDDDRRVSLSSGTALEIRVEHDFVLLHLVRANVGFCA